MDVRSWSGGSCAACRAFFDQPLSLLMWSSAVRVQRQRKQRRRLAPQSARPGEPHASRVGGASPAPNPAPRAGPTRSIVALLPDVGAGGQLGENGFCALANGPKFTGTLSENAT